jgi:hypothetical protein
LQVARRPLTIYLKEGTCSTSATAATSRVYEVETRGIGVCIRLTHSTIQHDSPQLLSRHAPVIVSLLLDSWTGRAAMNDYYLLSITTVCLLCLSCLFSFFLFPHLAFRLPPILLPLFQFFLLFLEGCDCSFGLWRGQDDAGALC